MTEPGNGRPTKDAEVSMAEGLENVVALKPTTTLRVVGREGAPLREWSNEALMLEHGRGSEAAFEELVRRHQKSVQNYMYRMVQNRQVGEELTQEVFLALVKNARRYEPTAKFTTYLYAIASNIVSKEWARAKRRPVLFSIAAWFGGGAHDDDDFDPLEQLSDERADIVGAYQEGEVSEAVNSALRHIPALQREAFVLRRLQGLSYEEVAVVTNTPVGTIKSRIVRAERALRPHLTRFRDYV